MRSTPLALAAFLAFPVVRPLAALDCPLDVFPLPPEQALSDEDRQVLDDFGSALGRFRGMSLEEFRAAYGPRKRYLEDVATVNEVTFLRGDPNADGARDVGDAICILGYLFLGEDGCRQTPCLDALDVDDTGSLDITDALALLQHLFLGGAEPPEPSRAAGLDPTQDGLDCSPEARGILGYEPLSAEFITSIFNHFPPSPAQEAAYRENGFVVMADVRFESMLRGFFEVYRRDLPVYISVDSILDALHLSFDRLLTDLEVEQLIPELEQMLAKMEEGIPALPAQAPGVAMEAELDDVALWVCVARALLRGEPAPCARAVDGKAGELIAAIAGEDIRALDLFGAPHCEDFSQFKVRGHYTRSPELGRYFRAMMWIQRIPLKFVQFRRQAAAAALLTRLLADTGAQEHWERIHDAVEVLVGTSDSLNPPGMAQLLESGGYRVADLLEGGPYEAFRAHAVETGAGRQRINSQILIQNPISPEGFTPIPPVFHLMGQRFIVDSFVFTNVVFDRVCRRDCPWPYPPCDPACGRYLPSPLDAWFVLGNRAALPLLQGELEIWDYQTNLAALDWIVEGYPEDFWDSTVYNGWLSALKTLDEDTTSERYPPVMRTRAWDHRMLNTQLASWAQLRRDTVLYAKPSMPVAGCMYPDGWVDPYPQFYDQIASFASRAKQSLDWHRAGQYFSDLETACHLLGGIARTELQGLAFTAEQNEFIRSWLRRSGNCGFRGPVDRLEVQLFDGWYPQIKYPYQIFQDAPGGPDEGFEPTIADIHTDSGVDENYSPGGILHVAVGHPNLLVLSVKNECGIRSYAGPVLSYFEFVAPKERRWTDEEWKSALEERDEPPRPAWTRSFIR